MALISGADKHDEDKGPLIAVYCSSAFVILVIVIIILRKFCCKKKKKTENKNEL